MATAPYWKQREWWEEGQRYRIGVTELSVMFGDVSRVAWCNRRRQAKRAFPDLDWLDLVSGAHIQYDQTAAPDQQSVEERVAHDTDVGRLKARISDLESRYDAALRMGDVEDRIIEAIAERVPRLPPAQSVSYGKRGKGKPETVVALVSDAHIGEVVDVDEMGGLNHYDFDTFMRRWQYQVDSIGGICFGKLTGYDLPRLQVCMLGDMVSGIIHDELVETSDGTLMDWLIDGSYIIAQGIRQLSAEFKTVDIDSVFGNHGRVTQKKHYKRRWVNFDYLLTHLVALHLKDCKNVSIVNNKSFFSLVEVEGHHLLNLHGDDIKSWNGIPFYGIQRAVTNLSALLRAQRRQFEYVNVAHFHNAGTLDRIDSELTLNGSIIGGNEYSVGRLFVSTRPAQIVYGMHPDRGKTWQYAMDVSGGDVKPARFAR